MNRIHFIAIGGAVMHQLALALKRQGHMVTGSDDEIRDPARSNLVREGLLPEQQGWFPEKINPDLDAVVLGMHARADNPELLAAQRLQIPVYSFPAYLYELSRNKKRVVVAGSHGKTTVTAMIMHVLQHEGADFDYMAGAAVRGFEQSVRLSDAPLIVLEGDEYPAAATEPRPKIFFYKPDISVLNGIAWDHVNVFPDRDVYYDQFRTYLGNMRPGALLLYNAEDEEVCRLVGESGGHLDAKPYRKPVYRYENGSAVVDGGEEGEVKLSVFGSHNLLNMQAALEVCLALGVSVSRFYGAIASFTGAASRLEKMYERPGLVVFRDFAHAPSKLQATLEAVREAFPEHTLVACFELHTYSSLNAGFLGEYTGSMAAADQALVYFSTHALSLKGLPMLDEREVQQKFGGGNLTVTGSRNELERKVRAALGAGEQPVCLLLMSSGSFDGIDWNTVVSQ